MSLFYRCNFSGKEVDLNRSMVCQARLKELVQKHPAETSAMPPHFFWREEYDPIIEEYILDRYEVYCECYRQADATLTNHLKKFSKEHSKLKAVK